MRERARQQSARGGLGRVVAYHAAPPGWRHGQCQQRRCQHKAPVRHPSEASSSSLKKKIAKV